MKSVQKNIGVIGTGQMGEAVIQGMLAAKLFSPDHILGSDKDAERLKRASKRLGFRAVRENRELSKSTTTLILSVKPQNIRSVLLEISLSLGEQALLVSIAAGVRVKTILDALNKKVKVIRAMPNIAVLAGQGVTALFSGPGITQEDEAMALKIFGSVGQAVFVKDENLLDAVTGLSGSGPAYVFLVLEALSDAGVRMGLPRKIALDMAVQTILGSAHLARVSGKSLSELKEMVTSPGGTTLEGLKKLEDRGVRAAFMEAVEAATARARQLSGG